MIRRGGSGLRAWGAIAAGLLLCLAGGMDAPARAAGPAAAAEAFAATLSPKEAALARRPFAARDRRLWRLSRKNPAGLLWAAMDPPTARAADALMRAALSPEGWRVFEATRRTGEAPSLTLFGRPGEATGLWSFRCASRDLSLNFTYRGDALISATPISYIAPKDVAEDLLRQAPHLPEASAPARRAALEAALGPAPAAFRSLAAADLAARGALGAGHESGAVQILQGGQAQLALEEIEDGVFLVTLEDRRRDFGGDLKPLPGGR